MWRLALLAIACQPLAAGPRDAPICDGTTDDTAALQRAFDRGGRVVLPAARVCRFTRLTLAHPLALDLAHATLKGALLRVTADHVAIRAGTIDGDHQPGWLVDWHGRDGTLEDVTLQNGDAIGLSVSDPDTRVVARRVVARNFTGTIGLGFRVGAGALITSACGAEANTYAGFFVSRDASSATVIDGWTARNGIGVAVDGQRGGHIAHLRSRDDDRFGLLLDHGAAGWRVASVHVEAPGRSAHNRSGTGVELFARNHDNVFGDVTVIGAAGYGLAIAGGSLDNHFTKVELDARGAWDGDPGLVIAGGSHDNRVDTVRVLGHTIGIRIGENDLATDAPNNHNHIGAAYIEGARFNAIRIERGDDNDIGAATIADSDGSGSERHGFPGVVHFGNDSSRNHIGTLVRADTRASALVFAGPHAIGNVVDHVSRGGQTAPASR